MHIKVAWLTRFIAMAALGFAFAGSPFAQTTSSTDVRKFEVISVDGNKLVVRGDKGTQELTVPDDFRFTVDGKKLAVSDLKPGMKGTATVTTKTTVTPVIVTELREAEVLRASDMSMTVRTSDGKWRRFTRGDLKSRGLQIVKDGKTIQMGDLKKGDKLTATIITEGPPAVLTEKEVQATLDESKTTTAAAPTAAPATGTPPPAPKAPAPQPSAPAPAPATPAAPSQPATTPAEGSGIGAGLWVLIAIVIAAILYFVMRKKK